MPASAIDSAIFRDIFGTEADAAGVLRRATACRTISTSRRRWRACRRGSASSRRRRPTRSSGTATSTSSTSRSSRRRPSASAIRCCRWCSSSSGCAGRARRMVPLGRDHAGHHRHRDRACRSARRSSWSRADIDAIADALAGARASSYRDTPMAGRSNLQQAVPITFGYKMRDVLLAGFERHRERLARAAPARARRRVRRRRRHAVVARQATGSQVQDALMKELGLGQPEIAWHTMRDRIAEVGCFLGLVTGTLRQDRDRREADDADRGRGGLRAVRRGPRLVVAPCRRSATRSRRVYITACAAVVRQHVAALLDAMVEDHERATGPWEIEWIVLPEIFLLVGRRAGADRVPARRACRSTRSGCAPISTSPRG